MADAAHVQDLMRRLADGDRDAFDPLFAALWPGVRATSVRLLGDVDLAEDASQATMLAVFREAARFDPRRRALAWVMTLTYWECRTVMRQRTRSKLGPLDHEVMCTASSPESLAAQAELRTKLEAAIEELGSLDRAQIRADLAGEGFDGVAPGTIRKRRQRALDRLRETWRRLGVES